MCDKVGNDKADDIADGGVVIAANYRLGPLGFLSMRELSSTVPEADGASGNYGLWDCAAALHWARANVRPGRQHNILNVHNLWTIRFNKVASRSSNFMRKSCGLDMRSNI